jgi:hypothetical protein
MLRDLGAIRTAMAAALSRIGGVQVSAYMLTNPTPPAIQMLPAAITYDEAGSGGLDELTMTVQAFAPLGSDIGSQESLDELLNATGTRSIKANLEFDPTLGGLVQDVHVTDVSTYRVYVFDGRAGATPRPPALGVDVTVVVYC